MRLLIFFLLSLPLAAQVASQDIAVLLAKRQPFHWYVDSVNGSDDNAGRSRGSAFKTIAKLKEQTARAGLRVCLVGGSSWHEELDWSNKTGITISSCGSGKLPTLDASDVIATGAMSQNGTYPVVYEVAWTPPVADAANSAATTSPQVYENNVLLRRVADLATCNSTPGSFYASKTYTPGTPTTVYFQATDSSDPRTNEKVYEQSVRNYGIRLGDNSRVYGVRTKRNAHYVGSLVLGRNSVISNSVAEDGTVHNLMIGSGTVQNTIAYKADPYINVWAGTGSTMFVGYHAAAGSPKDALLWSGNKAVGLSTYPATSQVGGFYSHGGTAAFGTATFDGNEAYYMNGAYGAATADNLVIRNSMSWKSNVGIEVQLAQAQISGFEYYTEAKAGTYCLGISIIGHAQTVAISDYAANLADNCTGIKASYEATLSVTRASLVRRSTSASYVNGISVNEGAYAATPALTQSGVVFGGFGRNTNDGFFVVGGTTMTLASNDNVLDNTLDGGFRGKIVLVGTTYKPIGGYLTAYPAQDTRSSINTDPGWVGNPELRDYSLSPTGAAGTRGAGAVITPRTVDYAALVAAIEAM